MYDILTGLIKDAIAEGKAKPEIEKTLTASGYTISEVATAFSMIDNKQAGIVNGVAPVVPSPAKSAHQKPLFSRIFHAPMTRLLFIKSVIVYFVAILSSQFIVVGLTNFIRSVDLPIVTLNFFTISFALVILLYAIDIIARRIWYMRLPIWCIVLTLIPVVNLLFILYLIFGPEE